MIEIWTSTASHSITRCQFHSMWSNYLKEVFHQMVTRCAIFVLFQIHFIFYIFSKKGEILNFHPPVNLNAWQFITRLFHEHFWKLGLNHTKSYLRCDLNTHKSISTSVWLHTINTLCRIVVICFNLVPWLNLCAWPQWVDFDTECRLGW